MDNKIELSILRDFFNKVSEYPKDTPPPYNGLDYIKARIYDAKYRLDLLKRDSAFSEANPDTPS